MDGVGRGVMGLLWGMCSEFFFVFFLCFSEWGGRDEGVGGWMGGGWVDGMDGGQVEGWTEGSWMSD